MGLLRTFRKKRAIKAAARSLDDSTWAKRSGWKAKGPNVSVGWFRFRGSPPIRGRVETLMGLPKVFMHRPPEAVVKHICVYPTQKGWFYLHPHGTPMAVPLRVTVAEVQAWLQSLLAEGRR